MFFMKPNEVAPPAALSLSPLPIEDAQAIVSWRYHPDYATYDLEPAHVQMLTDPANRYFAIRHDGELVGHVCLGPEARVAGLSADPDAEDIGLGFRPDLVGKGTAREMLPLVLGALSGTVHASRLRAVVASWNERAQAAARNVGFEPVGEHVNSAGRYVILSRRIDE